MSDIYVDSLTGQRTFHESLGSDPKDIYHFHLDVTGHYNADRGTKLQLSLYGMNADADLRLIRDSNSNNTLDSTDELIASSVKGGSLPEYIDRTDVKAGDYFVEVSSVYGDTNYVLEMNTPNVYYEFTYNYGDGEYYKGYGYTKPGENFHPGQVIQQASPNETGQTGYYVIDSAKPTSLTRYGGAVTVREYFDLDSGYVADQDKNGGAPGHLHDPDYPFDPNRDFNLGRGYAGLGSERGIVHTDGHPSLPGMPGTDTTTFAVFSNFYEADMILHAHAS